MANFFNISGSGLAGKILRAALRLIPRRSVVPILQGPLKGWRWIKGAGVNGYWMGTYEKEKQKLFAENVKPGDVVYDIGAHVGFYTLVASKLVGENGFVYAFEPLPGNVGFIMKHVRMNKCKNTFVVEKAVTDNSGMVHFKYGDSSSTGEINTYGKGIEVEAMSIDDFSITNRPPAVMKIDVEGEEAKVLTGAEKILAENSPVIFLAIHGENRRVECVKILKSAGYKITEIVEGELFAVKGGDSQKEHPKL